VSRLVSVALTAALVLMFGWAFRAAEAVTPDQAEQMVLLSAVEFEPADSTMPLGRGVVIGATDTDSYVLTDSHVFHNKYSFCPYPSGIDSYAARLAEYNVKRVRTSALITAPHDVIADDRCRDLAVVRLAGIVLPVACFARNVAQRASIGIRGPVVYGKDGDETIFHDEWRINVALDTYHINAKSGKPPMDRVLHNVIASDGFSGAGLFDISRGAFVGIQRGKLDQRDTAPDAPAHYIATATAEILDFLKEYKAGAPRVTVQHVDIPDLTIVEKGAALPGVCFGHRPTPKPNPS